MSAALTTATGARLAPPAARARADASIDDTLSSTTPDVPARRPLLSIPGALGWGAGIGAGLGALLLRPSGAGWALGSLGTGAWKGAAIGAGIGAALIGLDRITGGEVKQQLDYVSLDRRAQIWFVVTNPTRPWIAHMGLGVAEDARAAQVALFGRPDPLDGPQDAFRHAYAAALFSLRAMRDHGEDPAKAHDLAIRAGAAHEADGQDNNDDLSRGMDTANNSTGTQLVGDGRAARGEAADAAGFVTERALADRVLAALGSGQLQLVDRDATPPGPRASTAADLPRA